MENARRILLDVLCRLLPQLRVHCQRALFEKNVDNVICEIKTRKESPK